MPSSTKIPGTVKFFLVVMLLFNGVIGAMVYQQLRVARFPTTVGMLDNVGTTLRESTTSSQNEHVLTCPAVVFSYTVDGQTYQSDTLRKGGFCSSEHADVQHILGALEAGNEVTVYYNPANLSEAYLMAGLSTIDHLALLFFFPFNLFALGWVLEIASLKIRGHKLEPDVMRFGENGDTTWARFPRLGPVKFAMGVLLVVGFLLVFGGMFWFSTLTVAAFHTLWQVLGSLTLLLLVGKAIWNRVRPSTATYHTATQQFTVPGKPSVHRSQIITWEVEEILGKASKRPIYFRPQLEIQMASGDTETLAFPTLPSREEAYRFCDWLVAEVGLPDGPSA